jgi:hypothetical protein
MFLAVEVFIEVALILERAVTNVAAKRTIVLRLSGPRVSGASCVLDMSLSVEV